MLSTDQVTEGFVRSGKLALNCWVEPSTRLTETGDTELVLATLTAALALFFVSARLVTLIVCVPASGGARYKPETSIGPVLESPLETASTDQVTAVLAVPVTVTPNCMVVPAATFVEDG